MFNIWSLIWNTQSLWIRLSFHIILLSQSWVLDFSDIRQIISLYFNSKLILLYNPCRCNRSLLQMKILFACLPWREIVSILNKRLLISRVVLTFIFTHACILLTWNKREFLVLIDWIALFLLLLKFHKNSWVWRIFLVLLDSFSM